MSVKSPAGCLGDAEVDHLGHRLAVLQGDQNIAGFEIAMNDSLLMRMLDRQTDGIK